MILGFCGCLAPSLAPITANASTPFQVTTWNLAQGNDTYRSLYNEKIMTIVAYMQTHPSWQLSTQETCNDQAAQIVWSLNANGASFSWFWGTASSGSTACSAWNGGTFGNAVLNIGTPLAGYGGARFHVLDPHAPPSENKNVICGAMQNFGFRYEGCSLHTSAYASSYALDQAYDAQAAIGGFTQADAASSVVAGDFNIPYQAPLSSMPWQFTSWSSVNVEASLPTFRGTQGAGPAVIDYLWAQPLRFGRTSTSLCTSTSYSDHRICPGLFSVS